jgi:hypothetical protein
MLFELQCSIFHFVGVVMRVCGLLSGYFILLFESFCHHSNFLGQFSMLYHSFLTCRRLRFDRSGSFFIVAHEMRISKSF